ncbi:FecR family protein [Chryseobacterium defluvii]|uniref:FecR family protein n=1 Tax=Chryseobacterium defluvii TaxID=160396 RepID=A0A495SQ38_9FLAO|nr:FecR domain-containing protein [Chryseobacterium defluvii]RKT01612.1 FecR family protein [Chryseobacterium defluvii]
MKIRYKNREAFVFKLWQREISNEKMSEKENRILEQWKIHAEKDLDQGHMKESKERVLLALEPYFAQPVQGSRYPGFTIYKIAAVILLMITLGSIFTYHTFFKPDIYVATSGNRKVHLADGSVITLLPGARLTVEKSFPSETRLVDLKGDAVFSVAKSKTHPFVVRAEGFSTKVLGTVFKISQSGTNKEVDLYEGKVAVSSTGVPVSYLKPNQTWTNFGLARTAAVISFTMEKKSGKKRSALLSLSFSDVALKEVAEVLQKNYSIKILYPKETAEKKITADFTGGSADENIEALAFILDLEVQKENQTYILKK